MAKKKDQPSNEEDVVTSSEDVAAVETAVVETAAPKKSSGPVQVIADAKTKYLKDPYTGVTFTSRSKVDVNNIPEGGWLDCQIKAGLLHIVK